jgi:small subunit ribosomal protein S15
MLSQRKKKKAIREHGVHDTDTGSAPIQVALLTKRIDELTDHLKHHAKDNHSRRGLLKMVGKRRRLLKYLQRNDTKQYSALIKKLDLKR